MQTTISVVVRVRDEVHHLDRLFDGLGAQTITPEVVVVVDARTTDRSAEVAEQRGAKVQRVERFTYGRGLNVGMALAQGECCVLLSAHSLPLHRDFLEVCEESLHNAQIAGARCIMAGKRADEERWMAPEMIDSSGDVVSKGPLASGCVIRRSAWEAIPFDEEIGAAEDKTWARAAVEAGWLIMSPIPAVYAHLADRDPIDKLRRNIREREAIDMALESKLQVARRAPRRIASATWNAARIEAVRFRRP